MFELLVLGMNTANVGSDALLSDGLESGVNRLPDCEPALNLEPPRNIFQSRVWDLSSHACQSYITRCPPSGLADRVTNKFLAGITFLGQ